MYRTYKNKQRHKGKYLGFDLQICLIDILKYVFVLFKYIQIGIDLF